MAIKTRISPCLWFDNKAEEAAKFYVSIFADFGDSAIDTISRYGTEGFEIHGHSPGSVLTVAFRLAGHELTALNGGPEFKFSEAISLQIFCETQPEIDYFWNRLSDGGEEGPCGWLKDKFGLSWQVVPAALPAMLCDADTRKSDRVMRALFKMGKLDIAALQRAFDGVAA